MFDVYVVMCEVDGLRSCMAGFHNYENAVDFINMRKDVRKVNSHRFECDEVTYLIEELTFMD